MLKIVVYDLLGKEVRQLVNQKLHAGNYRIKFNASSLPSGIYFYRMEASSINSSKHFFDTKKMLLLK